MTKYICPNCNKDFKQKSNYESHTVNKKNPCIKQKDIKNPITAEEPAKPPCNLVMEVLPPYNLVMEVLPPCNLVMEVLPPFAKNDKILANLSTPDEQILHKCRCCGKEFTRKDNLTKHLKFRCKNKKYLDNIEVLKTKVSNVPLNGDNVQQLLEENTKLIKMLEECQTIIKQHDLLKQAIPLAPSSVVNTNNTNNNTNNTNNINNGAINNGNINNTNVNVTINGFGKEDISKYDSNEMMNVYYKSTGGNIFSNMLKYFNFNPKYPENFNILMSDLSRENVKIYNGEEFITKKFKNVKDDILYVLNGHITNMCDNYTDNPKTKKDPNVISKIKINNISVKLILNDDITPLLLDKKEKDDSDSESDEELDEEGEKKLVHYESKRQGLQEITDQKLKDELYNGRMMVQKQHSLGVH